MSEFSEVFKKQADDCYKKCKGACLVESSDTIKLHLHCNFCRKLKKVKSPGNLKAKPIKKKRRRKLLHTEIQERLR